MSRPATMTGSARLEAALSHREPDRVPFDLGSCAVTGINIRALRRLRAALGLSGEPELWDPVTQLASTGEEVASLLRVDVLGVRPRPPSAQGLHRDQGLVGEHYRIIDELGIGWQMPREGGHYYDLYLHPLAGAQSAREVESYPWPDAESGRTRNLILALNGLVRVGHRKPFALDLSAGLAYTRWEGDMKTLFYAKYWLGGHSVLMSYTYKLKMICGPEGKIGFNAGIACDVAIVPGFCLMIEGRYAVFSSVAPMIRFELIPGTGYITPEDESAVRNLVPNFLPIDPSSFRFAAGFKISL